MGTLLGGLGAIILLLNAGATPVAFTEVSGKDWPPAVRAWLGVNRVPATGVVHDVAYSYLLVAAGQKRSGGYSVRFTDVTSSDGKIVASAVVSEPGPRESVTMAITYPVAVARIPRTALPVEIRVTAVPRT